MQARTRGLVEEAIDERMTEIVELAHLPDDTSVVSEAYARGQLYALLLLLVVEEEENYDFDDGSMSDGFERDLQTVREIISRRQEDIRAVIETERDDDPSDTEVFDPR